MSRTLGDGGSAGKARESKNRKSQNFIVRWDNRATGLREHKRHRHHAKISVIRSTLDDLPAGKMRRYATCHEAYLY